MMLPSVSIVLSCYKRANQLRKTLESIRTQNYPNLEVIVVEDGDDGQTQWVARQYGARYFQKKRTDLPAFQNPSRVHNIGIKQATGEIVILQGGEIMYKTPRTIYDLVDAVTNDRCYASPAIESADKDGKFLEWYSHPIEGARAGWIINFCLAVRKCDLLEIGGFEESYIGYGFEDDQLMFSLQHIGLPGKYVRGVVTHQWHERTNYDFSNMYGSYLFTKFKAEVLAGDRPCRANWGKEWGSL